MSVKDSDKQSIVEVAKHFYARGFRLIATSGTAAAIQAADIPCLVVNKVGEGHPNLVDVITCGAVDCIINTTTDSNTINDSYIIRQSAISQRVSYSTTVAGGLAMSISLAHSPLKVRALQHWHRDLI